eukprot:TRINITY_DN93116_c0_g1_i1.p1 TRINITY_DN93116_c0_g1~~TRINITY_DN93116_c0_g1_i1.p1  ORF type:complete len:163 (+),score=57.69 TRINITY_DN93116_c0_g1_i1:80-568(+)
MVTVLSSEQKAQLKEVFDASAEGMDEVDNVELFPALEQVVGMKGEALWRRINRDPKIDFFLPEACSDIDNFMEVARLLLQQSGSLPGEMLQHFQACDVKGKGWLDQFELKKVLTLAQDDEVDDETAQAIFEGSDLDADGKIDYDEFVKLVTALVHGKAAMGE